MKLVMNSSQPFMRMSALVFFLMIGCSSIEISAGKKSCKHCDVFPHLVKAVAWGVVTICSAYLILKYAGDTVQPFKALLNNVSKGRISGLQPILIDLLQKGCVIGGLVMLLRKAAVSTVYNFERL